MAKYTDADRKYIAENYGKIPTDELADKYCTSRKAIMNIASDMRKAGLNVLNKCEIFTDNEDEYIALHWNSIPHAVIGKHLGFTRDQITKRVAKLKEYGLIFDEPRWIDPDIKPMEIEDGYPICPWHMRQSTRSQRLTLDWEPDRIEA